MAGLLAGSPLPEGRLPIFSKPVYIEKSPTRVKSFPASSRAILDRELSRLYSVSSMNERATIRGDARRSEITADWAAYLTTAATE